MRTSVASINGVVFKPRAPLRARATTREGKGASGQGKPQLLAESCTAGAQTEAAALASGGKCVRRGERGRHTLHMIHAATHTQVARRRCGESRIFPCDRGDERVGDGKRSECKHGLAFSPPYRHERKQNKDKNNWFLPSSGHSYTRLAPRLLQEGVSSSTQEILRENLLIKENEVWSSQRV